ncbi:MAG: hypothetical protein IJV58_06100, partial [Oscillospiraceae bacterium]|nr:hypothetical protein [Oscillospiraceae bacterium]
STANGGKSENHSIQIPECRSSGQMERNLFAAPDTGLCFLELPGSVQILLCSVQESAPEQMGNIAENHF